MVEDGIPYDTAGALYGLSKSTIYEWIRKGNAYRDADKFNRNPNHRKCALFSYYIKRARAIFLWGLIKSINDSSAENKKWDRDWSILVRRDRANWGPGASKRNMEVDTPENPAFL